jgi:flagellar motor protein MotB
MSVRRKIDFFVALLIFSFLSASSFAQMHHYVIAQPEGGAKPETAPSVPEKKEPAESPAQTSDIKESAKGKPAYHSGSFMVTPVGDCFVQLKPGETNEIRKNFENPWQECQRRVKERAEAERKSTGKAKSDSGTPSGK